MFMVIYFRTRNYVSMLKVFLLILNHQWFLRLLYFSSARLNPTNSVYQGGDFFSFKTSRSALWPNQSPNKELISTLSLGSSWPLTPTYCWCYKEVSLYLHPTMLFHAKWRQIQQIQYILISFALHDYNGYMCSSFCLTAQWKGSLYFGNGQVLISQYVKINKKFMLQSRESVPDTVPHPKSISPPPCYWRWWLVNSAAGPETCSMSCKNYLLFQLSLCCDEKWLDFASVLFCNIKIFSSLFFVPFVQQPR